MNDIEIMSPAGSFESLSAAIKAGADSVYFGAGKLNMRSRSSVNFSCDDMEEIAAVCRRTNVRGYLALNTVIYDDELPEMRRVLERARTAGIDAVIAADISVIQYARAIGMPVHISVQANVSNIEAVRFYAQFADVMVLARELTLPQIREIITTINAENITGPGGDKIKIEIFAHGALCVSVSGKCYMSLGTYNSSANRGACLQNCRRAYRVIDEETGEELVVDNKYVMSPKDICTVNVMDQLIAAGVRIFKLEGRGRSPDYVYTVTKVYKDAARAYADNSFSDEKINFWIDELSTVFNRGFWLGGYYLGEKLGEWTGAGGNRATRSKHHIAKVNKFFAKLNVAELYLEAGDLNVGDELFITGTTTGAVRFTVDEIRLNNEKTDIAPKGSTVSIPVPEKVRTNDKVYLVKTHPFGETTAPVNG